MKKVTLSLIVMLIFTSLQAISVFGAASKLESAINPLIGVRYSYGGTTVNGFDCSGFTMYVFNKLGVKLPHQSRSQAQLGSFVEKSKLQAGDLVFFNTDGVRISHVGIYLGNGVFAHASSSRGVTKSRLSEKYYATRYVTARRIMKSELVEPNEKQEEQQKQAVVKKDNDKNDSEAKIASASTTSKSKSDHNTVNNKESKTEPKSKVESKNKSEHVDKETDVVVNSIESASESIVNISSSVIRTQASDL